MDAPDKLFTARDSAWGSDKGLPAATTIDGVFVSPSSPRSWPPAIDEVEVLSATPFEHWRNNDVWYVTPGRTVRSVPVSEIFGERGKDIGRYLHALARASHDQLGSLHAMHGQLAPLLGIAWDHADARGMQGTAHWAEESIFRSIMPDGTSALDSVTHYVRSLGMDPYLLRVVPLALVVFDDLDESQRATVEQALLAVAA